MADARCPHCHGLVEPTDQVCKHCNRKMTGRHALPDPPPQAPGRKSLASICWTLSLLGSLGGAVVFFTGMAAATSAPQEASAAAMGLAAAAIPYVLARSIDELTR